jgi:hypothetical protein
MDTATEDSSYADNASVAGSEADMLYECSRYEYRDPPTHPLLALTLTAPPTGRADTGRWNET